MHDTPPQTPTAPRLRLYPALVILAVMWLAILAVNHFIPATMAQFMTMFWLPLVATLATFIWWAFASRAPRRDRWLIPLLFIAAAVAVALASHPSVRWFGVALYGLRAALTAWVFALLVTRALPWRRRRAILLALIGITWAYLLLLRFDGVSGAMAATFHHRWERTPEEQFLAEAKPVVNPAATSASALTLSPTDWPAFRGPNRDGRLAGVRVAADWSSHSPTPLWRHRIGPGWGSIAVVGDRCFTQEQRGPDEAVVCYHADTGQQLWAHTDAARFTESVAGPGPRATPTFDNGRLYSLGAAGQLNCLDAATGTKIWARNAAADSAAPTPPWGFAASPLVARDLVTVFTGGPNNKAVTAYRAATGDVAWSAGQGKHGYCSTQLSRLAGVDQILYTADDGLTSLDPTTGALLWRHEWQISDGMSRITQPALVGNDDVLLGTGFGLGTRRLHVSRANDKWQVDSRYTTRAIKPYFNDLVVHAGHIYGFDGVFLACVDAADGKSKWRTRDYGSGQVLLLADQSLLLVLSETGEAALVDAAPDAHRQRTKFQALEGKTWNHPVIANNKLFVRNGEEIAVYALPAP